MPWCDTCDRFYNPNTLNVDGTCPTCGRQVADPMVLTTEELTPAGASWHFKLVVAATAVYLSWRLFDGVLWVAQQL